MAPPTILAIKQSFLASQTRLLAQPLPGPSRAWRAANDSTAVAGADEGGHGLPERAVEDAVVRLNQALSQHARRVYAPQATRHVAEQIDQLYWNAGERAVPGEGEKANAGGDGDGGGEDVLGVGADYADPSTISSLPPAWEPEADATAYPMEAARYTELVAQLQGLAARREAAEARVQRLRRLRDVLAPFRPGSAGDYDGSDMGDGGGGGGGAVQENLVTRDGEVERELERMRMLLARVGDRVARLPDAGGHGHGHGGGLLGDGAQDAMVVDGVEEDERRKVEERIRAM